MPGKKGSINRILRASDGRIGRWSVPRPPFPPMQATMAVLRLGSINQLGAHVVDRRQSLPVSDLGCRKMPRLGAIFRSPTNSHRLLDRGCSLLPVRRRWLRFLLSCPLIPSPCASFLRTSVRPRLLRSCLAWLIKTPKTIRHAGKARATGGRCSAFTGPPLYSTSTTG